MTNDLEPTVLIVDDEPALADGHAARLATYDTRTAYGGEEALEELDRDVDVVLLDRRMPGLSGDDVLDRIRERDVDCRVVMLTGVEPTVDIVSMQFDDYLIKPVSTEELESTIERMCHRSTYDAKLQEYYALASKRATLETRHGPERIQEQPKYQHLCDRMDAVQDELSTVLEDLPDEDGYLVATAGATPTDTPTDGRSI